ncbi:hypothetical protein [Chryseobacterium arthrosphaerae]|uniref:hypothetical protein n=1 Tax=Chryseobacterium arthrosphaerae TaxID=651561 RepID=UPI001F4B5723|nr:hypothetical protein [Chryseobacterium arthrosphaerae]
MKTKILLLILLSSLMMGCRSKHKITTTYKENTKEKEKVKTDSSGFRNIQSVQSKSDEVLVKESKDEISGDLLIQGKSDASSPFTFHQVIGGDTIQSISIKGTAEYSISNRYTKGDYRKQETKTEESANRIQDSAQQSVSKEAIREVDAKISEQTKNIKLNGLDAAAWVFITIMGITLTLLFFTYKYFKK